MKLWKKLKYIFCVSIVLVMLLDVCSEKKKNITSQSGNQLGKWLGKYEFYEYFPPNINMEYNISIYQDDDEYFANINIDGFQTTQRIRADVIGNTEGIELIFDTYLSENTGERIEKGIILLSLKKEDSEIHTYWGTIKPILPENMDNGKIYFTKVKE